MTSLDVLNEFCPYPIETSMSELDKKLVFAGNPYNYDIISEIYLENTSSELNISFDNLLAEVDAYNDEIIKQMSVLQLTDTLKEEPISNIEDMDPYDLESRLLDENIDLYTFYDQSGLLLTESIVMNYLINTDNFSVLFQGDSTVSGYDAYDIVLYGLDLNPHLEYKFLIESAQKSFFDDMSNNISRELECTFDSIEAESGIVILSDFYLADNFQSTFF